MVFWFFYNLGNSGMRSLSEMRRTSSFTMIFGETLFVIFFNSSRCLSKISLHLSNMYWSLVSICLSLSMSFDEKLFVISFSTWVYSDIFSVSYLRLTSSFPILFDETVFVTFFNSSCCFSNRSSYWSNMDCSLVSRFLSYSISFDEKHYLLQLFVLFVKYFIRLIKHGL